MDEGEGKGGITKRSSIQKICFGGPFRSNIEVTHENQGLLLRLPSTSLPNLPTTVGDEEFGGVGGEPHCEQIQKRGTSKYPY